MDPSCFILTVQAAAGSVMVKGTFCCHILNLLVATEHGLNTTAYLSTTGKMLTNLMALHCSMVGSEFSVNNELESVIFLFFLIKVSLLYSNALTRSQYSRAPLGCGGTQVQLDKTAVTV